MKNRTDSNIEQKVVRVKEEKTMSKKGILGIVGGVVGGIAAGVGATLLILSKTGADDDYEEFDDDIDTSDDATDDDDVTVSEF